MVNTFPGKSVEDVSHTVESTDGSIYMSPPQLTIKDFHDAARQMPAAQQDYSQWTFGKCVPRSGTL